VETQDYKKCHVLALLTVLSREGALRESWFVKQSGFIWRNECLWHEVSWRDVLHRDDRRYGMVFVAAYTSSISFIRM